MICRIWLLAAWLAAGAFAADTYNGPRPPKPDIPYLLHGDRLIETEIADARQENRKGDTTFVIPGASSPARTPMPEPIFIMESQQISPERMELYKLDVKNGQREVGMGGKKRRGGSRPIHVLVTRLGDRLYRIEADEMLENGEYSLSPSDANRAFCFEVY